MHLGPKALTYAVRRGSSRRAVLTVAVVLLAWSGVSGCKPRPDAYVALGDSFTAGPLIPDQSTDPLGCLRSDRNYPSVAYPTIPATRFVDVSCSGAEIEDLYAAQGVTPGPNPPQLDALDFDTKIVTLGISGNDIGFSDIVEDCAAENPFGRGCRSDYVHDGRDEISERIAAVGPQLRQAVTDIKTRAARAEVFLVGYPHLLPHTGNGCYPFVPILPGDVVYLRAKTVELNSMIQDVATAAGVHFVDLYAPSVGHDMCDGDRWVESIVPLTLAAPVHPNAKGMAAFGAIVSAAVNEVVTE